MELRKIKTYVMLSLSTLSLIACSSDDGEQAEPENPDGRTAVAITSRTDQGSQSNGLEAGLYMVNFHNGQHDDLLASNNYVNNQLLTWSNDAWSTETPIYWSDMETPADFYAYAPYQQSISNAREMPFSVQTNQNVDGASALSDFLWGTIQDQSPTAESFNLTLSHQFSQLTITIIAEQGFDESELLANDVAVTIGGTKTNCQIDLQTGEATTTGAAEDVLCRNNGDLTYTAILIPQQVPFSNLIQVDWKGNKYTLQNSFILEAKRQYSLTVKLKKSKSGFDIGIAGWDIIGEDFGGVIGGN